MQLHLPTASEGCWRMNATAYARWHGPGLEHSHDLISRENKKTGTRHDHQAPSFLQFSLRQKLIHLWNIFTIEIDVAQSACDSDSVSGIQVSCSPLSF